MIFRIISFLSKVETVGSPKHFVAVYQTVLVVTRNATAEKTSNLNSSGVCGAFSCELAVCTGNRPRVSTSFTGFLPGELSSKWTSSGKLVGGT